tara:strand:- start:13343 stop:14338 length:996 start_codon:yes stop_codon:yes gene_type:complete
MTRSLFNALNVLKVFGAALVVASHYAGQYFGISFYSYGTGCFFVVTGYYALNWERSRGTYYVMKRLVRLYPAFLLAVLAYLITQGIDFSEWPRLIGHHLTFLLTTPDRATAFALNPPFWSLPVFFTFFVLIALLPRFIPKGWQVLLMIFLAGGALYLELPQWREGYIELWAFPLHLYAFWLGGWLGHRAHHQPRKQHVGHSWVAGVLTVVIVVCGFFHPELTNMLFWGESFLYRGGMVLLYGALLWAVIHSPWLVHEIPVLTFLGTISFGIYLFHNLPVYWFSSVAGGLGVLISLGISLLLAWLSWHFFEQPLQKWCKPRLAKLYASKEKT